jgi:hypothetical protein
LIRYKGKDEIEFGHKNYSEANYGGSPGVTPTTLFRVGYVTELTPLYDPELNRIFALRDDADAGKPVAILSRRENVGLRITWLQGQLGDYWQEFMLSGDNFFAEAKVKRDASNELYLFWTGLKTEVLTVRCSIGEPITWSAELVGKTYDSKDTTIHSYGSTPGSVWEWDDAYVEKSENDSTYTIVPEVTDWEIRVDNQLKPNFTFNETGSKQLKSLEEMEQICSARLTMSFQDRTYLDYLVDQTELYIRLNLPSGQWIKLNKGRLRLVEPVLKPEDLIACRLEFEGAYLTHSFT